MKYVLNLFFKNNDDIYTLFHELKRKGYNGTVFETASLKHAFESDTADEKHFINLSHIDLRHFEEATFAVFVVDENKLEDLKNIIRAETLNFTKMRGGMYSHPAADFEGSI